MVETVKTINRSGEILPCWNFKAIEADRRLKQAIAIQKRSQYGQTPNTKRSIGQKPILSPNRGFVLGKCRSWSRKNREVDV